MNYLENIYDVGKKSCELCKYPDKYCKGIYEAIAHLCQDESGLTCI